MDFNFEITCEWCTINNTCALGHTECNHKCLDYEPIEIEEELIEDEEDYPFDAYDYYDAYLDDKDDGLIPPDYEL